MRFVLFVEGHTEKAALPSFLARWLNPQLTQPVRIDPVRFDGAADMIKDVAKHANISLNAPKQDVIAVIGLLDLYGLPLTIPAKQDTVSERCAWAKQHLERQVNQPKFRQFFAVHETEAWLLSQPSIFPEPMQEEIAANTQRPELVNNQEPPAKLLERFYQSKMHRGYKKTVDGGDLFAGLNPAEACERCPHLKQMLDEMLQLARDTGL